MNQINKKQMRSFSMLSKNFLFALSLVVIISCENDDTQTVAKFTELVMADEFDTDGALNSAIWGYDIGTGPTDGAIMNCNTIPIVQKM